MGYGFQKKRLEGEVELPYEVVLKEVTLPDGTVELRPVKVYQKISCSGEQTISPNHVNEWVSGLIVRGV